MPKVETYNEPRVQSRSLDIPLQNFDSRGAFGEAVGAGLQDAGSVLGAIAEKTMQENDSAVTKERINQYRDYSRQRLFDDEDAFYNRQGRDAYDTRKEMRAELEKKRKELEADLSPAQLRLYGELSTEYVQRDVDGMTKHAAKGRVEWLNNQDQATVLTAQEDASRSWNDNDIYLEQIKRSTKMLAQRNGWPAEMRQVEEMKALTAAHLSAIENAIEVDPEAAEAYFDAHRDDILPSLHDDIQKKIDVNIDTRWAQHEADRIRVAGGTRQERMAQVNEIEDPERRKLVKDQVYNDFLQEKYGEEEERITNYDDATTAIREEGQSWQQYRANNFDAWLSLSSKQRLELQKPEAARATVSDRATYYELTGLMATDRNQARTALAEKGHLLNDSDYKAFTRELFSATGATGDKLSMTNLSAFNFTMKSVLGAAPTSSSSKARVQEYNRKYNILYGMYEEALKDWRSANPNQKVIPNDARQAILDQFEIQSTRKDIGPLGLDFLNPDEEGNLGEIPSNELAQIKAKLEADGYPVTTENIMQLYMTTK